MDDKFRRPGQNESSEATSSLETDWRSQLPAGARESFVNKLVDTMKTNLSLSREGLLELKNIAVRYEEMFYTSATSQNDYLGKICLKLMTMETKSKNLTAASRQSDAAASQGMQSHMQNQVQQNPIPGVPSQINITSIAPNSAGLTPGLSSGQAVLSSNTDKQICESQQVVQQERHHQHPQPYVYNHQLQHLPLKRKLEEGIISQSFSQSQTLFQESQLQSSQSETPRPSSSQPSALSRLNQLPSPPLRQHNSAHDANKMTTLGRNILKLQKQQQPSNQHYNLPSMHQQQLVTQNVSDFQQQMVGVQQAGFSLQSDPELLSQKSKVSKQKQMQQTKPNLMPDQAQQTQHQKIISEVKSLPNQLYQGLGLPQSGIQSQGETHLSNQWTNSPFEELTMLDQQSPLLQLQGTSNLPITSFTSSSQASIDDGYWLEELFPKIDVMDLPDFNGMYQMPQHYSLPQQTRNKQLKQLQYYKAISGRAMKFLPTNKTVVEPNHWEKIEHTSAQASVVTSQLNDLTNLLNDSSSDDTHGTESTIASGNSNVVEQPLERLIKVMKSMSHKALSASVDDIKSVVSMVDSFPGSTPWNGSEAAVGEDLATTTKCRLYLDGTSCTKKMRRYTSVIPSSIV